MSTAHKVSSKKGGMPVWQLLNRLMLGLIVIVSLLIAALAFIPEIKRSHEEKHKIEVLRNEIRNEELILKKQRRELDLLKTSPEYVEIIARDKMDLMKDDEIIFRIDSGNKNRSELESRIVTEP